jgi:hypothetical protein
VIGASHTMIDPLDLPLPIHNEGGRRGEDPPAFCRFGLLGSVNPDDLDALCQARKAP